jgi:NADH dehydrogenase [ubiquinone] 1 alpha subcomplex assembly factor 7
MTPSPLTNRLKAHIEAIGPMPLDEFMQYVLYDPDHGYYYQKIPIGREGDYITAPEMTQAFGEVIAIWLIDIWEKAGKPTPFHLIELGPGRGTLMADMLKAFQSLKMPLSEMTVHLMEISPPLKALQQEALSSFPTSFQWHENFKTLPGGFSLIVGNEFWDALPIVQFTDLMDEKDGFIKRSVGLKDNQLVFLPEQTPVTFEMGEPAYFYFLAVEISDYLKKNGGAALFLDYGYDDENGAGDTLQAVFRHQRCSPLENIGQADITHLVDFHNLKIFFGELSVYGPVFQGNFLKTMGLDVRTERLCASATPEQRGALRTAAVRLTHPAHMGTLFKVMGVVSDPSLQPSGFS